MKLARLFATGAVAFAVGACVSLEGLVSGQNDDPGGEPNQVDPYAGQGSSGSGRSPGGSGSASSSSSSSGAGTSSDSGSPPPPPCPGKPLPPGVWVGSYCVDSTEVTNFQYDAFLNDVGPTPAAGSQPAECAFNTSYAPNSLRGPPGFPVTAVNWCQAHAYCKWAGKRLCGSIGGGSVDPKTVAWKDPNVDQWHRACTFAGTRVYPYGGTYLPTACNGSDVSAQQVAVPVMTYPKCEGGYSGIFDMSGNVREWEDSCDGAVGEADRCRTRGGAADNGQLHLTCDHDESYDRSYTSFRTGFRCCSL